MCFKYSIPTLYTIVWGLGIVLSLYNIVPVQNISRTNIVLSAAIIYIVFLLELFISYIDVGFSYRSNAFSSKLSTMFGFLILDIVITISFGIAYLIYDGTEKLYFLILSMCGLKYTSCYFSRNTSYFIYTTKKLYKPNCIKQ